MIRRKLNPALYNIPTGIPVLAQKWPEFQQYLLTRNIYLMGEAPLKATSSREVSFEPGSAPEEASAEGEYDRSEDGQQDEEDEIFNPKETRNATSKTRRAIKGKNPEDACNSRSTSIIDTIIGGTQSETISVFEPLERQKSPTRASSKSQSASQTKETSKSGHMKRGFHTIKKTAGDGDPDDPHDASEQEPGCNVDDRRPNRHRRPDKEQEAEETDRSVR